MVDRKEDDLYGGVMKRNYLFGVFISCLLMMLVCAPASADIPIPKRKPVQQSCHTDDGVEHGRASWYGPGLHGEITASGKRFDMNEFTAAHRTLSFGTRVQLKNKRNGQVVVVKITDRGPFIDGRVIDVSKAAAKKLGFLARGTAMLEIRRCLKK